MLKLVGIALAVYIFSPFIHSSNPDATPTDRIIEAQRRVQKVADKAKPQVLAFTDLIKVQVDQMKADPTGRGIQPQGQVAPVVSTETRMNMNPRWASKSDYCYRRTENGFSDVVCYSESHNTQLN